MSIEGKLQKKQQEKNKRDAEAERKAEEERLAPIRNQVKDQTQQKKALEKLSSDLDSAYEEADRILELFKGDKEKLEEIYKQYSDILKDEGIKNRTGILESKEYADEPEVKEYQGSSEQLRDAVSRIQDIRKRIQDFFPKGSEPALLSGEREESREVIAQKLGKMKEDIHTLEAQMSEGREKELDRVRQEITTLKDLPRPSEEPDVPSEVLKYVDEYGEDLVIKTLTEHYLQKTDRAITDEKERVGYLDWERVEKARLECIQNKDKHFNLQDVLDETRAAFERYINEDTARLEKIQTTGAGSVVRHLMSVFERMASKAGVTVGADNLGKEVIQTAQKLLKRNEENVPGIPNYDQAQVGKFYDATIGYFQKLNTNGDFESIMPGAENADPEIEKVGVFASGLSEKFKEEYASKAGRNRSVDDIPNEVRDHFSQLEDKWKGQRSGDKSRIALQVEQSLIAKQVGRIREQHEDVDSFQERLDAIRKIQESSWIDDTLNKYTDRADESLSGVPYDEAYPLTDDQKQEIDDLRKKIGNDGSDGSPKTGLHKEIDDLEGKKKRLFGKDPQVSMRELQDKIKEAEQSIYVINQSRSEIDRAKYHEEENKRISEIQRDIDDIVWELRDYPQLSSEGELSDVVKQKKTVGEAMLLLKQWIEKVKNDEVSEEEQRALEKYHELQSRASRVRNELLRQGR